MEEAYCGVYTTLCCCHKLAFPCSDSNGRVVEVLVSETSFRTGRSQLEAQFRFVLCKVCVHAQVRILLRFISMQVSLVLYWLV